MYFTRFKGWLQARRTLGLLFISSMILLASTSPAHGQVDVTFGIKGTGMLSTFQGDDSEVLGDLFESAGPAGLDYSYSLRPGFGAGAFVEFEFDDLEALSIRPEAGYMQRGDKREDDSGSTTYSFTTKLNYVEIPIILKLDFGGKLYLVSGPFIGFSIGSPKVELENLEFTNTGDDALELEDIGVETESNVYGAVIGFGATADNFWAELRYEHGISDIFEGSANIQNQGVSLTAGFEF